MNIGYYAHHHGTGHCRQADKLAAHWQNVHPSAAETLTVFTSLPAEDYKFSHINAKNIIRLPDEHETATDVLPGRAGIYWQPECLHYSPIGNHNIQRRSNILLSELQARHIELMIVDLSVEIALLCRTASIPYLYVRLPGDRNDPPHRNAFQGALALLAPYPKILESTNTPEWVRQKTFYLGFLSQPPRSLPISKPSFMASLTRLANNAIALDNSEHNLDCKHDSKTDRKSHEKPYSDLVPKHSDPKATNPVLTKSDLMMSGVVDQLESLPMIVTVVKGFGGHKNIDNILPELRQILPNAYIISLGPIDTDAIPYVDLATQVDSVIPFLQHSDLMVMACGLNAIGEVCQYETPLIVIPDERPHAEQEKMAESLIACGRAIDLKELYLCYPSQEPNPSNEQYSNSEQAYDLKSNTSNTQKNHIDNKQAPKSQLKTSKNTRFLHTLQPSASLVESVSWSNSGEFVESIARANSVKQWFYEWLLPQLSLQPDRPT